MSASASQVSVGCGWRGCLASCSRQTTSNLVARRVGSKNVSFIRSPNARATIQLPDPERLFLQHFITGVKVSGRAKLTIILAESQVAQ